MGKINKLNNVNNPIAIIGMGCKFPGANNTNEFWDVLKNGKNTIQEFSLEKLRTQGIPEELLNNRNYVKKRGILDDIDSFDNQLFNIPQNDLAILGISPRILLHLTWQALEDAGIPPLSCPKRTSVFIGSNDEALNCRYGKINSPMTNMKDIKSLTYSKSSASFISYQFGLQGTAVNLYTGCSSSLVAVTLACQDLILDNSDLAIAAGISIENPQEFGYLYEEGGILSADGLCRTFDAKASGSVISNGIGVIILKRLTEAIRDNDNIHAIIMGYSTNNDGKLKTGFLAPGINGQYECIKEAWKKSGINLNKVNYIEAHGSATLLGDPIELYALKKIFAGQQLKKKQCGIGSAKTNIGHTAVASGMAAIIKTALMLKHRAIVPSLHFEKLNPNIPLKNSPFYIAKEYRRFDKRHKDIVAGVSNFGFGGTNVHIVLKNRVNDLQRLNLTRKKEIMTFSAANTQSLIRLIRSHIDFFSTKDFDKSRQILANACFTTNCGRSVLKCRAHVIFNSHQSLLKQIKTLLENNFQHDNANSSTHSFKNPKFTFVISNYGLKFATMANTLYRSEPTFGKIINECLNKLDNSTEAKVKKFLLAESNPKPKQEIRSLSLFIFEYALVKYLMTLGIIPDSFLANGIGELVAKTLSGVFKLSDTLRLLTSSNLMINIPNLPIAIDLKGETKIPLEESIFIEIIPDGLNQLQQLTMKINKDPTIVNFTHSNGFIHLLGKLWDYGANINWSVYYEHERRAKMSLPTYCFVPGSG